jgi:hypothetical protein
MQETRTERVTVAITPREKRALELVAKGRGLAGPSVLLRELSVADALNAYEDLLRMAREEPAAA